MAALNRSSNLVAWVWLRFHKDLPLTAVLEKTNQASGRVEVRRPGGKGGQRKVVGFWIHQGEPGEVAFFIDKNSGI